MTNAKSNRASPPRPSQGAVDDFVHAARDGNNAAIMEFLDKYGADFIDAMGDKGQSPPMTEAEAAWLGRRDIVALMREKDKDGRKTALMRAAEFGHGNTAALLLEKGADIDATGDDGKTALMLAEKYSSAEVAALLRQWPETQRRQTEQKEQARAAGFSTEARIKKLRQLRPAKLMLKKSGNP